MNRIRNAAGSWLAHLLTRPVAVAPALPVDLAAFRARLQPADVILVEGHLRISAAIKYLTQSTWSHAVLYIGGDEFDCIEADIILGVRQFRLEELLPYHLRICRPISLAAPERDRVTGYAISRLGALYDLRHVIDLARYLLPVPVPRRWRRRAIAYAAGDPTRAICSTLIAEAFHAVGYPILPEPAPPSLQAGRAAEHRAEIYHIHNTGLFTPRDFDLSPFFQIIKPETPTGFDHHRLTWVD